MTRSLLLTITIIFFIHFILFLRFSLKRKESQYIFATSSFLLLTLYGSLRLWEPGLSLFGQPVYTCLRILAWISTMITLLLFVRNRTKRVNP